MFRCPETTVLGHEVVSRFALSGYFGDTRLHIIVEIDHLTSIHVYPNSVKLANIRSFAPTNSHRPLLDVQSITNLPTPSALPIPTTSKSSAFTNFKAIAMDERGSRFVGRCDFEGRE